MTGSGTASAQSQTGWVGGTPPTAGVIYLHSSTISDTPSLSASTALYPSFGQSVPAFRMGVQSRLFKSGVLCQITPWQYNPSSTSRLENRTAGDCGTGSYNSHGFVQVSDGNQWSNYVTFPSNPIDFVAPPVAGQRSSRDTSAASSPAEEGINANGESYGSAEGAESPQSGPQLIAAYGEGGNLGYVQSDALVAPGAGTLDLLDKDGTTVIGTFRVK